MYPDPKNLQQAVVGPVEQALRRDASSEPEVDLDAVPLTGPHPPIRENEAALVVLCDDGFQLVDREGPAVRFGGT